MSHIDRPGNSMALQIAGAALMAPPYIVYSLAGPATYGLLVITTWQSDMSLGWKVVYWLTIDLVLAALSLSFILRRMPMRQLLILMVKTM